MRRIVPSFLALFLAACSGADGEAPSPPREADSLPAPSSAGPGDDVRTDSVEAASAQVDTAEEVESFGYLTEEHDGDLLSPWREADPAAYSGNYLGEFGDTGFSVTVEVRASGGAGHEVAGVLESTTAGSDPERTPFGPTPLRMTGSATRFDAPNGSAAFMIFSPEGGEAPLRGLLLDGQFYAKEQPES